MAPEAPVSALTAGDTVSENLVPCSRPHDPPRAHPSRRMLPYILLPPLLQLLSHFWDLASLEEVGTHACRRWRASRRTAAAAATSSGVAAAHCRPLSPAC